MSGLHHAVIGLAVRKKSQIVISSNQNNYVLNTAKIQNYTPGIDVELVINSGVVVGSTSTGSFALTVDSSWSSQDSITIINNGYIAGLGGKGGDGWVSLYGSCCGYVTTPATAGLAGGPALLVSRPVKIINNGVIAGGGGGGGGYNGSGGGGRGSNTSQPGAPGQSGTDVIIGENQCSGCDITTYSSGGYGSINSAGAGGAPDGGAGGSFGSYGASGYASGGAPGACTSGNSNITWVVAGARYGALN